MNILYVHGLLGSANGDSVELLKKSFPNDNIFAVEYDNYDCLTGINDIKKYYFEHDIDLIIGCSLGGFYAQMLSNRPKILINPAFNGGDDIEKYIDKETISKLSPTFVSDLNRIRDFYLDNYYDYETWCETTTIFCKNDDVITFDDDRLALYNKLYHTNKVLISDVGQHRLTSDIIPTLAEIINEVKNNVN